LTPTTQLPETLLTDNDIGSTHSRDFRHVFSTQLHQVIFASNIILLLLEMDLYGQFTSKHYRPMMLIYTKLEKMPTHPLNFKLVVISKLLF